MSKKEITPKSYRINLVISAQLYKRIQEASKYFGINTQGYIRQLIIEDLKKTYANSSKERQSNNAMKLTKKDIENISRSENQEENFNYKFINNKRDIKELLESPEFNSIKSGKI